MDASLNLEGGIHFVLAWIMLFLLYPFHFSLSTLKQKTRVAKPFG